MDENSNIDKKNAPQQPSEFFFQNFVLNYLVFRKFTLLIPL